MRAADGGAQLLQGGRVAQVDLAQQPGDGLADLGVAADGVVGVDGDREPGRHRQPGGQQLPQAGVLAAQAGPLGRVVAVQPAHEAHRMPSHQSGRSVVGGTWTSWTRLR